MGMHIHDYNVVFTLIYIDKFVPLIAWATKSYGVLSFVL